MSAQPGDMVQIRSKEVPLPEFPASVVAIDDTTLEVLSTILVPFHHSGKFKLAEIEYIVVYPAEVAVEQETGFKVGTDIQTRLPVDGKVRVGTAHCGFDRILVIKLPDGQLLTGGASHFEKAEYNGAEVFL